MVGELAVFHGKLLARDNFGHATSRNPGLRSEALSDSNDTDDDRYNRAYWARDTLAERATSNKRDTAGSVAP